MRPALFAALALAAALPTAPALAQEGGDVILPGWWSYHTHAFAIYDKTERRCIKPHEINRFMSGTVNHHLFCDSPFRNQSFGPVTLKGVCRDKRGHSFQVVGTGAFSPTSLDMQVRVAGFIPVDVHARRLAAVCPTGGQS